MLPVTKERKVYSRLSLRIILWLFSIILAVSSTIFVSFSIIRALGVQFPESRESMDVLVHLLVGVLPLSFGIIITVLFAYLLQKTVIVRVRKLKEATARVANGKYDCILDVRGRDELSELAESFNRMTAELQANEYLSKDFVRNVSHEYKTPLSVVKAYCELIEVEAKRNPINGSVMEEYAQIIMGEVDRLARLNRNILQLSMLDSTTIIKKEDIFSPAEQIREIFRIMQVQWSEKNIEFDLNLEETAIKNNEQLLYQIWQNLISNAIKFSPQNGRIKSVLTLSPQWLSFEIADEGVGISDADKEKIFTQFYVADKSRNTEGSGLGLSIVKKIVEKLGGEISFGSNEGQGSVFRVRLDIRADTYVTA